MAIASRLVGLDVLKALRTTFETRTQGMGFRGKNPVVSLTRRGDTNPRDEVVLYSVQSGQTDPYVGGQAVKDYVEVRGECCAVRDGRDGTAALDAAWAMLNTLHDALLEDRSLGVARSVVIVLSDYSLEAFPGGQSGASWYAVATFTCRCQAYVRAPEPEPQQPQQP